MEDAERKKFKEIHSHEYSPRLMLAAFVEAFY